MKWFVVDVQQVCIDSEHADFAGAQARARQMVDGGCAPGAVKVLTKPRVGTQVLDPRDESSWKPRRQANPRRNGGKITRWSHVPPWGDTDARTEDVPERDRLQEALVGDNDGRLPLHTQVQSLVFNREMFTVTEAVRWAEEHGFVAGKVDESDRTIRIRQQSPDDFAVGTFRTKELRRGVHAVIAMPRDPHWGPHDNPRRPYAPKTQERRERERLPGSFASVGTGELIGWAQTIDKITGERPSADYPYTRRTAIQRIQEHKNLGGEEEFPETKHLVGMSRRQTQQNPGELLVMLNPGDPPDTSRGEETFRMWHQKEPKGVDRLSGGCHDDDQLVCIGRAYDIEYRSGKWQKGNKTQDYIHDFESRPKVWMLASVAGADVGEKTVKEVLARSSLKGGRAGQFEGAELARPLRFAIVENARAGEDNTWDLKLHSGAKVYGMVDHKTVIVFDPKWKIIVVQGGKMYFDERGIVL